MNKKISGLTALATTFADTDLLEVSVDMGGGTYTSRKMTFLQLRTAFTKLQANLDVNAFEITTASNGNVIIKPNGTGAVLLGGNSTQATELRFMEDSDNGTNYVALKVAAALAASTTYTLPTADGTNGQVLSTNGSGTLSWTTAGAASGAFGIANNLGVYTYYSTLTLAMAAATSGQTIEMFADVVETGAVEITLKNGVNINGNGHTYTLNNNGLIHAFRVPVTVETSCNILNLNVIRTGSTGTIADNSALILGTNGTGTINCTGSTFKNNGSGCGIVFSTNSLHSINYAVAYATTIWGAIGIFSSAGVRLNNCIGYGTSGGFGIRCHSGGDLSNCTGYSDSGYGLYGGAGNQSNCIGISTSGNGFFAAESSFNCVGRSISGIGFEITTAINAIGCVGISTSGRGISLQNSTAYNCTGISSSSNGVSLGGSTRVYNITAKSTSSYALFGTTNTTQIYGGYIICNWNNAAGYGIRGNGGFISNVISNCVFNLSNASAPYLFNDGIAQAISMRGNTYQGGAAFNANLTQAIVATEDNQGNIFL